MFNFNGKTNVNIIVNSRLKIHNYNNPSVHNFRLRRRRLVSIKLEQITRPLIVCEITMIFTWKLGTSSKYNWWCRSLRRLMTPKLALYWSRSNKIFVHNRLTVLWNACNILSYRIINLKIMLNILRKYWRIRCLWFLTHFFIYGTRMKNRKRGIKETKATRETIRKPKGFLWHNRVESPYRTVNINSVTLTPSLPSCGKFKRHGCTE